MMFLQIMLTFTHLVVGFILVCEIMLLINYHHGVFHVSFLDIAVCTKVFGAWTSQHPGSTLLAMPNLINFTFPSPTQDLFLRSHTWDSFSLMNLLSLSLSLCLLLPNHNVFFSFFLSFSFASPKLLSVYSSGVIIYLILKA